MVRTRVHALGKEITACTMHTVPSVKNEQKRMVIFGDLKIIWNIFRYEF